MPEPESLEETLRRAATGDESAWRVIVNTYSPRVFGLIRAHCQNNDLAEEITQSTFCTIATKIGSYAELGRFDPWLFRIAMNRLRDEMRRRRRQASPVGDDTLAAIAGADTSLPSPQRDLQARATALWAAVDQLPEADRQILHLRHFADLSFKQIAEILGQPLGTVLARQHRALRKLRDLLGENFRLDDK